MTYHDNFPVLTETAPHSLSVISIKTKCLCSSERKVKSNAKFRDIFGARVGVLSEFW